MNSFILWDMTLLAACLMLVPCLAFSSALKMEVIYSSEILVDFHRFTQSYISEGRRTIHIIVFCGNLLALNSARTRLFILTAEMCIGWRT